MRLEDIEDPAVRAAAERFVHDTGKPLHTWIIGAPDEPVLRQLLVSRRYLTEEAAIRTVPFDPDLLEIRLALRRLSVAQRKGLAYGDPAVMDVAAKMVIEHLRRSGIRLQRGQATGQATGRAVERQQPVSTQ